ncbi:hypothetical protein [Candidatus Xiphinematobacter sp. Idaho Grape]|uniref:hypothetical protein n=1 Tax=Candidatus Xiphinematobacter sp. Idaho Grape TaxID=1704307 RepID=UPI0011DF95E0|nr:hypothetical protein [Candidatus Xiphinematobacter sp. Idaho Grape]
MLVSPTYKLSSARLAAISEGEAGDSAFHCGFIIAAPLIAKVFATMFWRSAERHDGKDNGEYTEDGGVKRSAEKLKATYRFGL